VEESQTSSDRVERGYMYKCRICGEIKQGPTGYFSIIHAVITLNELNSESITFQNGSPVAITDLHNCVDGSLGIADLIGVKNV